VGLKWGCPSPLFHPLIASFSRQTILFSCYCWNSKAPSFQRSCLSRSTLTAQQSLRRRITELQLLLAFDSGMELTFLIDDRQCNRNCRHMRRAVKLAPG